MRTITAGLLVRRPIRRFLLEQEIDFSEEKGWIDSVFYLRCSEEKFRWAVEAINNWQKEIDKKP